MDILREIVNGSTAILVPLFLAGLAVEHFTKDVVIRKQLKVLAVVSGASSLGQVILSKHWLAAGALLAIYLACGATYHLEQKRKRINKAN